MSLPQLLGPLVHRELSAWTAGKRERNIHCGARSVQTSDFGVSSGSIKDTSFPVNVTFIDLSITKDGENWHKPSSLLESLDVCEVSYPKLTGRLIPYESLMGERIYNQLGNPTQ